MIIASLFSDLAIPVPAFLLGALFALLFAVWLVFSLIVRYHWNKYGHSRLEVMQMNFVYFVGSGILVATTLVFLILYSLSSPS
jgi:hypothetical protein